MPFRIKTVGWKLAQNSVCIKSAGSDSKENSLNSSPPLALASFWVGKEHIASSGVRIVGAEFRFSVSSTELDLADSSWSFQRRPICSDILREHDIVENSFRKRETHIRGILCLVLCVAQSLAVDNVEWHMLRTFVVRNFVTCVAETLHLMSMWCVTKGFPRDASGKQCLERLLFAPCMVGV